MKVFSIYLRKGESNDATIYYVETIAEAYRVKGYEVCYIDTVQSITASDLVFVITMKAFLRVWVHNPRQRIVMWFQGIVPEEARMQFAGHWSCELRYLIWSIGERFVLKKSAFLFFVSKAMVAHYSRKYGFSRTDYYIMPCFNLPLDKKSFDLAGKYETPTFVYAGTLSAWQCIDQTLALCRAIEQVLPVCFTLLTSEIERGQRMAASYGLTNVEVKYVKSAELGAELMKYKYGFLLREDTSVNNVATPTKLNSYMASGVIPIYSDVIGDFSAELSDIHYLVKVVDINRPEDVIGQIEDIENRQIDAASVKTEFEKIFNKYYCRQYHIEEITKLIGI